MQHGYWERKGALWMTSVFLLSSPYTGVRSLSKISTSHSPHALASDMSMNSPRV
jgi:hypothetical protein